MSRPETEEKSKSGRYNRLMWRFVLILSALLAIPLFATAQATSSPPSGTGVYQRAQVKTVSGLKLTRTLRKGMTGADVKGLQQYLARIPGAYPESAVSGYFGDATEKAIQRLQESTGIANAKTGQAQGYGQVGPRTLAKVNELVIAASLASLSTDSKSTGAATSTPTATTTKAPPTPTAPLTPPTASTTTKATSPPPDTTPPVRSGGLPSNVLPSATTSTTISLITNEPAYCYWSNSPNTPFYSINNVFRTTGGTVHSSIVPIGGIGDYSFYVKCRDRALNSNTTDYPILFSVEYRTSRNDTNPPRVAISYPTLDDTVSEGMITLSVAAADNAGIAGIQFYLNSENLHVEDTSAPYSAVLMLPPGTYSAFATARDIDGNRATSTTITFSVVARATTTTASTVGPHPGVALLRSNVASAFAALSFALHQLSEFFGFR